MSPANTLHGQSLSPSWQSHSQYRYAGGLDVGMYTLDFSHFLHSAWDTGYMVAPR
jgi:hypothetical protein